MAQAVRRSSAAGSAIRNPEQKTAGLLIGFASEDDWLDYLLENDPRFLRRIERARKRSREGRGGRNPSDQPALIGRHGNRDGRVGKPKT